MVSAFVDAFQSYPKEADLSSQVDGVTRTFVVPQAFEQTTLVIYYNGVRQLSSDITVISSVSFTLSFIPQTGTAIVAVYQPI